MEYKKRRKPTWPCYSFELPGIKRADQQDRKRNLSKLFGPEENCIYLKQLITFTEYLRAKQGFKNFAYTI